MKKFTVISISLFLLTNLIYSQDIINETGKDGKFIVRDAEQQEFLIIKDSNVEIKGSLSIDSLTQGSADDITVVWSETDKQFKALYNLIPKSTINANVMAADSWTESSGDVYRASGNVGIGTSSPLYPVTVYRSGANASVVTSRDGGAMNYMNATATHGTFGTVNNFPTRIAQNAQIKMFLDKDNNGLYFGSAGNITSAGDDDIDMTIDTDGNVGIGTSSPLAKLVINSGASSTSTMLFQNEAIGNTVTDGFMIGYNGCTADVWSYENCRMRFGTNGFERMTIDSDGDVGIGTTNPLSKLHIYDTAVNGEGAIRMQKTSTGVTENDGFYIGYSGTPVFVWNYENTDLKFGTNNTNRMTIKANGDVGIGTTTPDASLDVSGDIILGSTGTRFVEIQEITGVTSDYFYTYYTDVLPVGWTGSNTRILSFELQKTDATTDEWYTVGYEATETDPTTSIVMENSTRNITIHHQERPDLDNRNWRMVIMKMP